MSRNMGNRMNSDATLEARGNWHESPGLPVRTRCPFCKQKKHSSQSHPRCSREMQKLRQQGVIL